MSVSANQKPNSGRETPFDLRPLSRTLPWITLLAAASACLDAGGVSQVQVPEPGEILIPKEAEWTDRGTLFGAGLPGEWDHLLWGGFTVSAIKRQDVYHLFYQGSDEFRSEFDPTVCHRSIGLSLGDESLSFHKYGVQPVWTWSPNGECEEGAAAGAAAITGEGEVLLFFGANTLISRSRVSADVRLALSADGRPPFEDLGIVLDHEDPTIWGHGDELFPVLAFGEGLQWFVYYVPNGTFSSRRLGVAWGTGPERLSRTARVEDARGRPVPVWGPAGFGRLKPGKIALFLKNGPEAPIEVRTSLLASPETVSEALATYSFEGVLQATVLLDLQLDAWLMFYRGEESYGLKTAPVRRAPKPETG